MSKESNWQRDPAFDFRADPTLLRMATHKEINAFVGRTGELFSQAHTLAGNINMGDDMPLNSSVVLDMKTLRSLPDLSLWDAGEIMYEPPLILGREEGGLGDTVSSAMTVMTFEGDAVRRQGFRAHRSYTFLSALAESPAEVSIHAGEIDSDALKGFSDEEIVEGMSQLPLYDIEDLAKRESLAAMGFPQNVLTRLELAQFGRLMLASITPEAIRIN